MRTLLAAVGVAGFFAAFAFAGGPNDLKTSFSCAGKRCTLKVTNNSGQPQSAINIGVNSGLKIASAKSAGTLESTFSSGGKTVTVKAGQCAVMNNGMQVNCIFASDAWPKGATKTVAITAAAAVAKGAAINVCPSNGGCRTTYFGAAPTSTTTKTEPGGADVVVDVKGPSQVDKGKSVQYGVDIRVRNAGPEATTVDVTIEVSPHWLPTVSTYSGTDDSPCFRGEGLKLVCKKIRLSAGAGFSVGIRMHAVNGGTKKATVHAHAVGSTKPDPSGNNSDSQATTIG
jgi:hypothetical protein